MYIGICLSYSIFAPDLIIKKTKMKKILLSACAIVVALATFAQSKMAELPKESAIKFLANDVPVNYVPSSSVAASAPAPFWFNEFQI